MGPVKFLFQQDANACWIWVHPASLPESYEFIQKAANKHQVQVVFRNDLARFELRGPHATITLKSPNNLMVSRAHSLQEAAQIWQNTRFAGSLPRGMVLSLKAYHPQTAADKLPPQTTISNLTAQKPSTAVTTAILEIPDGLAHSELWTHLREVRKDAMEVEEDPTSLKTYPLLLIQVSGQEGFGDGWDVICSVDVAALLFSKITKTKNVLPLPIFDRNRMLTEQGMSVFPDDYPDSKAFYNKIPYYNPKPHRKHSHDPYDSRDITLWRQLHSSMHVHRLPLVKPDHKALIKVNVLCVYGSTPETNSVLYLITDHDELESVRMQLKPIAFDSSVSRTMIGVVTTGLYSQIDGKGFGIAYCSHSMMLQLPDDCLVLMHNPGSMHLVPVLIEEVGVVDPFW
jgi:hypothetical protein